MLNPAVLMGVVCFVLYFAIELGRAPEPTIFEQNL
jgi:hypothetical protein